MPRPPPIELLRIKPQLLWVKQGVVESRQASLVGLDYLVAALLVANHLGYALVVALQWPRRDEEIGLKPLELAFLTLAAIASTGLILFAVAMPETWRARHARTNAVADNIPARMVT